MNSHLPQSRIPILVFTDLDGTLLDHDTYSFAAAKSAIDKLKALHIPIIPVTSKTLSELDTLLQKLDLNSPVIAENGGIIAAPKGQLPGFKSDISYKNFDVLQLSPVYSIIKHTLAKLKKDAGFQFSGFSEMTVEVVSDLTGLGEPEAYQAKERLCSEPLIWQDSEENLVLFEKRLNDLDYSLTRGGRFHHVMGRVDKGMSMLKLANLFPTENLKIALGDSPNDIPMLTLADYGVVINTKNTSPMILAIKPDLFYQTANIGPAGWQEFFDYFFKNHINHSKIINI